MKSKLILLFSLLTVCTMAFSQDKKSEKAPIHLADKGLIKVTILYPYSEGKTFNMEYYEKKHMPMVAGYLGANLVKYTIEKGVSGSAPDQPSPFMAVGAFYVKSLSEYRAAVTPHSDEIRADFANYTNVLPIIMVSEVIQ